MDAIAQPEFFDFPVIELKARRRGLFSHYLEATREHGPIVTVAMIASALGVSKQRVHFLIRQGRIASLQVCGRYYVPLASLELFLTEERKVGAPYHDPSLLSILKSAFEK